MAQLCGGDLRLTVAEFEGLTYRTMWDAYVEPNLPPEPDPEEDARLAEANAVAAALTMGADVGAVLSAFRRGTP